MDCLFVLWSSLGSWYSLTALIVAVDARHKRKYLSNNNNNSNSLLYVLIPFRTYLWEEDGEVCRLCTHSRPGQVFHFCSTWRDHKHTHKLDKNEWGISLSLSLSRRVWSLFRCLFIRWVCNGYIYLFPVFFSKSRRIFFAVRILSTARFVKVNMSILYFCTYIWTISKFNGNAWVELRFNMFPLLFLQPHLLTNVSAN